ncbi:MAG: cobyrinate a,c-diamide synthase [Desulfobacteraceae bacterium]|nr:MAG: cobyrinate a,c-diamide synthase [Desulfobacteraceae bacterium]
MYRPRIVVAALRGGSGKTILSVGIIAALRKLGKKISSFKKGPDYIDAGWLALAAGQPCYNLDTYLIPEDRVLDSFLNHSESGDLALIEGSRGLFDGTDLDGTTSTAELAKLLQAPVLLCLDCTKSTRTMAAVLLGCKLFDPRVEIKGVILNRIAGSRHEAILRKSIDHYTGIPILGAVPKLGREILPERHMGLVPTPEHRLAVHAVEEISEIAEKYLDIDAIADTACGAEDLKTSGPSAESPGRIESGEKATSAASPRIGIVRDSAFQFYYPENIQALEAAGGRPILISPLEENRDMPEVDALYIGGGFPETHAGQLAENHRFREALRKLSREGLPIYAECGGLMYLAQELTLEQGRFPMAGVLPIVLGFSKRPQGLGYTRVCVEIENPYFPVGFEFKGHEFHYSKTIEWRGSEKDLIFRMKRGAGVWNGRDGILYKNVLATYTHLHSLGVPEWAEAMVRNAEAFRRR